MTSPHWIELDGADNVRDVGGLPTTEGATVRPGRLVRSDSLQGLTDADVRRLVDDLRVRSVVDLRTGAERDGEGAGPMTREPSVTMHALSLFPEAVDGGVASADGGPVLLPWQSRDDALSDEERRQGTSGVYLRYLTDRPDSILTALRTIATTDGATVVHCAAGKDRTGVVVAFALAEVGVTPAAIVADYAVSAERVERIFARLSGRSTYSTVERGDDIDKHKPRAATMERMFEVMDERHGGIPAWLRAHGWTDDDAAALRTALLG